MHSNYVTSKLCVYNIGRKEALTQQMYPHMGAPKGHKRLSLTHLLPVFTCTHNDIANVTKGQNCYGPQMRCLWACPQTTHIGAPKGKSAVMGCGISVDLPCPHGPIVYPKLPTAGLHGYVCWDFGFTAMFSYTFVAFVDKQPLSLKKKKRKNWRSGSWHYISRQSGK